MQFPISTRCRKSCLLLTDVGEQILPVWMKSQKKLMGQIETKYQGMKIWIYSSEKEVCLTVCTSNIWRILLKCKALLGILHCDLAKSCETLQYFLKRKNRLRKSCFFQAENWFTKSKQIIFSEIQGKITLWPKSFNSGPDLSPQLARAFRSVVFVMEILTYTKTLPTYTLKYWYYVCDKDLKYHFWQSLNISFDLTYQIPENSGRKFLIWPVFQSSWTCIYSELFPFFQVRTSDWAHCD